MNDLEKIQSNWETFEKLCQRLSDDNLNSLLESLGERIIMTPASTRRDQYGCFPGGLIQHSLDVTMTMRKLNDTLDMGVTTGSILKVGLLHDLGKVGGLDAPLFLEQDSEWHRDKLGQLYKFNEDLSRVSVSHNTLFLLQHFGVRLTREEWLSIQLAPGSHFEENRFYVGHEPSLAILTQQAKSIVVHREKLENKH